jgi:hypothetical protein
MSLAAMFKAAGLPSPAEVKAALVKKYGPAKGAKVFDSIVARVRAQAGKGAKGGGIAAKAKGARRRSKRKPPPRRSRGAAEASGAMGAGDTGPVGY